MPIETTKTTAIVPLDNHSNNKTLSEEAFPVAAKMRNTQMGLKENSIIKKKLPYSKKSEQELSER